MSEARGVRNRDVTSIPRNDNELDVTWIKIRIRILQLELPHILPQHRLEHSSAPRVGKSSIVEPLKNVDHPYSQRQVSQVSQKVSIGIDPVQYTVEPTLKCSVRKITKEELE